MNRHQRRRAERRAAKAMPGYQRRLHAAFASSPAMAEELRQRAVQAIVEHDGECGFHQRRPCSCVPNISLVPFDGGDGIYEIDADGRPQRRQRQ